MLQRPTQAPGVFAAVGLPPVVWLFALFLAPLAVIWTYSFGENRTLVDIAITGSWGNYARALKPLYLAILLKSMGFAALTTVLNTGRPSDVVPVGLITLMFVTTGRL